MTSYLHFSKNYKIAYNFFKRRKKTVIFLHGLLSDMNGAKSLHFSNFCKKNNYSYLCFDFRGHGKSSGNFVNFGIGHWYQDLLNLIKALHIKKITLIGSSMGGWVAMLYALKHSKRVEKLIGIAPAPDFTIDLLWKELSKKEKNMIKSNLVIEKKLSDDFSYKYSPKLFLNSRKHFIKNIKKIYSGEVILFHGSNDLTVPYRYNDKFYDNQNFPKLINITIKNADHSMSDSYSLKNISTYI